MTQPRVAAERHRRSVRLLEVVAVTLLATATVGSAWCAFQASTWGGEATRLARVSSDERVEGARQFGLATQTIAYDSNVIALYAQAVATDNEALATFYREALVRKEFRPVLDAWEAEVNAGRIPEGLLEDQEYLDGLLAAYRSADAAASAASSASTEASQHANDYVGVTLILAVSLFFAGITSSFRNRTVRLFLLAAAATLIGYAATEIAALPVA